MACKICGRVSCIESFHSLKSQDEADQKLWAIRFRYITPDDMMTPMYHLPIEETHIKAHSADDAWRIFITDEFRAKDQSNYRKEEIYEIK